MPGCTRMSPWAQSLILLMIPASGPSGVGLRTNPNLSTRVLKLSPLGRRKGRRITGHQTGEESEFDPWRTEQRGTRASSPVRCLML